MSFVLTNNKNAAVADGGTIPFGSPVHGCGKGIVVSGNTISLNGVGYYKVTAAASVAVTGTANETLSMLVDGTVVATEAETPDAAGAVVNLPLVWVIRKACPCNATNLTFTLSGAGTVEDFTVIVEKI